jgi:hypothetical protein
MNATPQVSTHEAENRLATAEQKSSHARTSPAREWREVEQDIARLFDDDARGSWIADGSWRPLAHAVDVAETNEAHRNAPIDGELFSCAHAWFAQAGAPQSDTFAAMVSCGFLIGAIERTGTLIEHGRAQGFACDESIAQQILDARAILREAAFPDARIARQLDAAAKVLRRHGLRPAIEPRVMCGEGARREVTYLLKVPVAPERADDLNFELVLEEIEADIVLEHAFDTRFDGIGESAASHAATTNN